MEKIKSIFLSQNNTRLINNTILTTLDLINLENEKKMVIVNILLKHMNAIFKQFDCNKINESNIKSILIQFNKIVLKSVITEISNTLSKNHPRLSQNDQSVDQHALKYNRDFNTIPNNGVNYVDRSESSMKHNAQSFSRNNNTGTSLDNQFLPLHGHNSEDYQFSDYQNNNHYYYYH